MVSQLYSRTLQSCALASLVIGWIVVFNAADAHSQQPNDVVRPSTPATRKIATRMTGFSVPFKINNSDGSYLEVQLYLSKDHGQTWQFYGSKKTDDNGFPFKSDGDGNYWFALKTLDRNKQMLPEGKITRPELHIVVDTVQPKLDFRIQSDAAGRVVCRWQASDLNLKLDSLRISYQANIQNDRVDNPWIQVPVNLQPQISGNVYSDQLAWWPDIAARQLIVRIEISDEAGNVVRAERQIVVQQIANFRRNQSTVFAAPDRPSTSHSFANPGENPRAQVEGARPNSFATDQGTGAKKTVLRANKPMELVCEDGVCRLVSPADVAMAQHQAESARADRQLPAQPKHNRLENRTPRSERRNLATFNRPPSQIIGSPPEYAAPPVPDGMLIEPASTIQVAAHQKPKPRGTNWDQIARQMVNSGPRDSAARTARQPRQPANPDRRPRSMAGTDSIQWPSQTQPWAARKSNSGASTTDRLAANKSEPLLVQKKASQAPGSRLVGPTQKPGESFIRTEGDMIVSQSTTLGIGKQYGAGQGGAQQSADVQNGRPDDRSFSNKSPFRAAPKLLKPLPATGSQNPNSNQRLDIAQASQLVSSEMANLNQPERDVQSVLAAESFNPQQSTAYSSRPSGRGAKNVVQQITNSRRFQLQYGIQSVDPSGVAKVILWTTRDNGQSWQSVASDPDNASPFPVEVPSEGTYGFRIVIHSKDGLTGRPPSSGDEPDMVIVVDTTRPIVQITSAPYGRGENAGRMILNWNADDDRLSTRPIRLSYSPTRAGPWTTLVKGMRNTGRYIWKVEPHVPSQVYFRIEAVDLAGNVGVHELDTLVDLSGLVPRGRIYGLQSMDGGN